jgi:DNA polymerase/3'-5' exonuclease PolX
MNKKIIDQFHRLLKQVEYETDYGNKKVRAINVHRIKSIKTVIDVLTKLNFKITNVDQVKNIKGIGKGSLRRIEEILKTGKLSEINEEIINQEYIKYVEELANVFGIGRKSAFDLFTKYNIKSVEELKKLNDEGKIELPENVVKGLKYYTKIKKDIPREEMDIMNNILIENLYLTDINLFGVTCGSYRRLKTMSGDLDFLITHPSYKIKNKMKTNYLELFIYKLIENGYIVDSFTGENVETKYMGLFRIDKKHPIRRIDIRFFPEESYYFGLLYFTGPGDFNRRMRQHAINLGYTLNEYGLYDEKGKMIRANSEEEIFSKLGMIYLPPELRK